MNPDQSAAFITAVLVLLVSVFVVGLCVVFPWLGVALLVGGIVWLVRGWIRDG